MALVALGVKRTTQGEKRLKSESEKIGEGVSLGV